MKMNCEIILLVLLIAVIVTVVICIYKNMKIQNKELNKHSNLIPSPAIEPFENNTSPNDVNSLRNENQELKNT